MSHYYDTVSRAVALPASSFTAHEIINSRTPDSFDLLLAVVRQLRIADAEGDCSRFASLAATVREELHHLTIGWPERDTHCAFITRSNGQIMPLDAQSADELTTVLLERAS